MRNYFKEEINWEERLNAVISDEEPTLLSAMSTIVMFAKDSQLSADFWKYTRKYIDIVSKSQDINDMQSVLLSIITESSVGDNPLGISQIAMLLRTSNLSIMKYQFDFNVLLKRKLILHHSSRLRDQFKVSKMALDAFVANKKFERPSMAGADGIKLFKRFYSITHMLHENEIDHEQMMEEVEELFNENPEHNYVKQMKKYNLNLQDQIVLTHFCRHLVASGHAELGPFNYAFLYPEDEDLPEDIDLGCDSDCLSQFSPRLLAETGYGLIDYACCDGMKSEMSFSLTAKARESLLSGFNIKLSQQDNNMFVINHEEIRPKRLFFPSNLSRQFDELANLLSEDHYNDIRNRLNAKGLRCGFACLFYGSPGTGKTEMALQLAKKTGRDIMQVNIAEMKSMWVGESEKNVKALFNRYRGLVMNSKVAPILLFNEADAIISKRSESIQHAVDKMENSIQNIILQEMETLDGIMIATTNLEQNLDSAFERRFLYKVRFEKPDLNQRKAIWHNMIPTLDIDFVESIATNYDFSGGQIENIARKYEVDSILYGESALTAEKINQFCQEEMLSRKKTQRIGFCA